MEHPADSGADRKAWQGLKEEIIQAAPTLGIDKIGFATADPFLELKDRLIRQRELGYDSGFEEKDLDKRVYPHLLFDNPRSIIAIAVAYPAKLAHPPRSEPGAYRGMFARTAWGEDYHRVLRDRLERLAAFIKERVPEARTESMVDTGALADRAVAERAGIGWSGKNCAIITPEFGSWVFLGELLTNIPFPPDTPIEDRCGECTKCLEACPTQALVGPGQLNAKACISYLTQTKDIIPEPYREKIGNRLYGCDTCQVVCPVNKGLNWNHHPEFEPDPEQVKPLLKPILQMSNKEFKRAFGHTAAAWRGKRPIQRNAVLALGHFKDRSSLPLLRKILLEDERPELRATAAWSIGRIGGDEAVAALQDAAQSEQDETVLNEIKQALDNMSKVCESKE